MLKVNCETCGAPYEVDPRRIPASGLKMRCPSCGASFMVNSPPKATADALDIDLPAPKVAARPGGARPIAPTYGATTPAAKAPATTSELADLPAPKNKARAAGSLPEDLADDLVDPSGPGAILRPGMDFDLDLPAPKGKSVGLPAPKVAPAVAAPKSALAPDFDLDLPAPKAAPGKPAPNALDVDLPAPKVGGFVPKKPDVRSPAASAKAAPAPLPAAPIAAPIAAAPHMDSFDLDLPMPKVAAPRGAEAKGASAPLAQREPGQRPALAPDLELDLPTPKRPTPAASGLDLDLPTPKREPPAGSGLDLDLPTPKRATPAGPGYDLDLPTPKLTPKVEPKPAPSPSKSFSRPSSEVGLPAVKVPAKVAANLPKDSLAIDPSPVFGGQRAMGGLGDLDEVQVSFSGMNQNVDLPAPSNLPAVKRPNPAATMLGLGAPKLSKDSLDMPRGFGQASDVDNFEIGDLLPAPADLPKAKATNKQPEFDPLGELDLPAPGDLPVRKQTNAGSTRLGLGNVGRETSTGLGPQNKPQSTALGIGEMLDESLSSGAGVPSPSAGGFDFQLDLPPPSTRGPDASGPIMLERLSLPSAEAARNKATFGATMALGADDIELGAERGGRGLSFPGMNDDDPFGSLGRAPSNNQTMALDDMPEFGQPAARGNAFDRGGNANAFGELDFGLDNGPKTGGMPLVAPPRPMPVSQPPGYDTKSVEAELLGDEAAVGTEARPRKKRKVRKESKALPGYVWPIALVLVIGGVGVGLGMFTNHGYFGVYLLEQLLPAAGDPTRVAAAITQAEKIGKTDTFVDVRKSLVALSDARNEAGLNRELLARSLLNEALYQLRFGEDAQSAQRSVAILARVMERGADAKGLTLARAADAARSGDINAASAFLAQVPSDKDPLHGLVAGEIALLQKQIDGAEKAFREAAANGGGARAEWGLARALIAGDKLAEAEQAAQATLAESPAHPGALIFLARRAFSNNQSAQALDLVRKAAGAVKVGDLRARPSRKDRAEAWALAGQIEQLLDHPREAQVAYEAALAADPLRADSLIGSGTMLMRLGRARDALSRFESGLSAKPRITPDANGHVPMIDAAVGAVQALLILERPGEALPRITALSQQFPKETIVALWDGYTQEALEKWDEAEASFRKSIELSPNAFAGYVALSQLLFKRARPEEGARVLADATGKVKDSAEVRRMLGYSELTRNHVPESIHHFEAALRFDANDAGALLGLTTAQRKNGNLTAAEKALSKLEAVDPTFAGVTLERGQLLESRGDYAGAANAYKKALETRAHDTDLKLRLGAALVTAGRLDEAEAILPEVLKERPTSAEAEHFVGRLLLAKKETAQAVQHFERSIAFDALRGEYHLYLAWAYLDQGNLGGALTSINKALDRDPNLGDARWILGRIQLRTGAVKDAVASFQQALKLKPGRVEALANMGDAYDQLRDLPAAVRSYQEAVRQIPENGDWWFRLGALHLDRGSRDEARVALAEAVLRGDRLIEKPSWLADAHRLYAEVLRESGRVGEALEHYRVFLQLAPAGHADRNEVERIVRSGQR